MKIEKLFFFILIASLLALIVFKINVPFEEKSINQAIESNFTKEETNYTKFELDTTGFVKAKINVDYILSDRAGISLTAGCYLIRATTDACVGDAIIKGMEKRIDFRPSVYDIIADTFRSLGIDVIALKIVDLRNNTYIGQLVLQQRDKILLLDIRPSDGSAIALRFDAPIYINETLAKRMGEYIC